MKRHLSLILVILMLTGFFTGCSRDVPAVDDSDNPTEDNHSVTEVYKLYYSDSNKERFVSENRQITYEKEQDKFSILLDELIKGPQNSAYHSYIADQTRVYGTMKQGHDLIVNLSQDFCCFHGGVDEIIAIGSVVNTLSEFDGVDRVKILVEGTELIGPSGNPRGFMNPFENNITPPEINKEIVLYFCNQDATAVAPEVRNITVYPDISREQVIEKALQELIKGPTSNKMHKTIPAEVRVNSVQIEDNIVYVDFSREMHSKHWGGATGEAMTIDSILYTVTEFKDIEKVKITVEGNPLAIEHIILEEAIGRT